MVFNDSRLIPYNGDEPFLFLSYSHMDSKDAEKVIRELSDRGFRIWYDEGLIPGAEWDTNIARKIKQCGYLIALISHNYIESENCRDELNYARDTNTKRLLVYLEDVELPEGMAMRLGRIQAVFLYKDKERVYEKISAAEGISMCLEPPVEINVKTNPRIESSTTDVIDNGKTFVHGPKNGKKYIIIIVCAVSALGVLLCLRLHKTKSETQQDEINKIDIGNEEDAFLDKTSNGEIITKEPDGLSQSLVNSEDQLVEYSNENEVDGIQVISGTIGREGMNYENLFDGDINTVWCVDFDKEAYVEWEEPSAKKVDTVLMTTCIDSALEDNVNTYPGSWTLYGRNKKGEEWEYIRSGNAGLGSGNRNSTTYTYKTYYMNGSDELLSPDEWTPYRYFRLVITSTVGAPVMRFSGLALKEPASFMISDEKLTKYVLGNDKYMRADITSISFIDKMDTIPEESAWDVSRDKDGSVMAFVNNETMELTIAGKNGVLAPINADYLFANYCNLQTILFNGCFDTHYTESMNYMFYKCSSIEKIDLTGMTTEFVENMEGMFSDCSSLELLNTELLNTEKVKNMSRMFSGCKNITTLDVSGFTTDNATDMRLMFANCQRLRELKVDGFSTVKVKSMKSMFESCVGLKMIDVSAFSFDNIEDGNVKDRKYMFDGCDPELAIFYP